MFQSETYGVIDGTLYIPNEQNITSSKEYKKPNVSGNFTWDYPLCVEFDVQSLENPSNHRFRVYQDNSTNINAWVSDLASLGISDNDYHHLKVEVYQDKIITYLDDNNPVTTTKSFSDLLRVNFVQYGSLTPSTNVKNFVIYPI